MRKNVLFKSFLIGNLLSLAFPFYVLINYLNKSSISTTNIENKSKSLEFGYNYVINPEYSICGKKTHLLIVFVTTAPANFERRKYLRKTWFNVTKYPEIKRVFLVGLSNSTINSLISIESKFYKDIVQVDFIDTYYNLTLKTVSGLKWVSEYCSNSKFTLKIDDDIIVNSKKLIRVADQLSNYYSLKQNEIRPLNLMAGNLLQNHSPVRNNTDKWYISESEYPNETYPDYFSGIGYFLTTDLASKFYSLARLSTNCFKFEDVFIGMLALQLNVTKIKLNGLYHFYKWGPLRFSNFYKYKESLFFYREDNHIGDFIKNPTLHFNHFVEKICGS